MATNTLGAGSMVRMEAEVALSMEAEAVAFTHCSAASVTVAVAACMTRSDPGAIARLPEMRGLRNRLLLPAAHDVAIGTKVSQMARMAGARVAIVGAVNRLSIGELASALADRRVCALLLVWSAVTEESGQPLPAEMVFEAHRHDVPVIVHAAGETCWSAILDAGADLVLVSTHRAIGGPTCGIIAGRADLAEACALQRDGIGCGMRPTEEGVAGALTALRRHMGSSVSTHRQLVDRHWTWVAQGDGSLLSASDRAIRAKLTRVSP